jgi:hypothetical protein
MVWALQVFKVNVWVTNVKRCAVTLYSMCSCIYRVKCTVGYLSQLTRRLRPHVHKRGK